MSMMVKAILFIGAPAMEISIMKGVDINDLESEDSVLVFPYPNAKPEDVFIGIPILESSVYFPYAATGREQHSLEETITLHKKEFLQRFGIEGQLIISPHIS